MSVRENTDPAVKVSRSFASICLFPLHVASNAQTFFLTVHKFTSSVVSYVSFYIKLTQDLSALRHIYCGLEQHNLKNCEAFEVFLTDSMSDFLLLHDSLRFAYEGF